MNAFVLEEQCSYSAAWWQYTPKGNADNEGVEISPSNWAASCSFTHLQGYTSLPFHLCKQSTTSTKQTRSHTFNSPVYYPVQLHTLKGTAHSKCLIYRGESNITFIVNGKTLIWLSKEWSGSSEQALMVESLTTLKPFCLFRHSINPLPQLPFLPPCISQFSSVSPLISKKYKEPVPFE